MGFSMPRVPWVCSFVTVPFLVFCVSYGVISWSYLGPFIFVGFTFSSRLLFCIILLCFICGPGPFLALGASFKRRVLLTVQDRFLAPGARFEGRVLLAVRDCFDFGSQFCKKRGY